MAKNLLSAYRGVTTPFRALAEQIAQQGWEINSVAFQTDRYVAKLVNPQSGETVERYGPEEKTALANALLAVTRRNFMRQTKAQYKVGQWQTTFTNQITDIAKAYAEAPVYDPKAVGAWHELAADSVRRYAILTQQLQIEETDDPEPYHSVQEMCADIHQNKHFLVSRANADHPVWTVDQNVAFRVVHDIMGHCVSGGSFDWAGENLACGAHFPLLSPEAQRALFTECIGQTAYAAFYRNFGPQKVAYLDEYLEPAQQAENPAAHSGLHPSQTLAPTSVPNYSPTEHAQYGMPKPTYDQGGSPSVPGIVQYQQDPHSVPTFARLAGGQYKDPNWSYNTGIQPAAEYHAITQYGDPLEHDAVRDTAARIDTQWSQLDPSDPSQRAQMKQAIVNALRVVLLSPRKDLRWNAVHYQDIANVPADVTDPKVYWDTLEARRRAHNEARGRHPDAHLIYFKPRQRYYQLVAMMNPNLSHDEAIRKADKAIFEMRNHEEQKLLAEDAQKPADKQRHGDEIERRVNEAIAKKLKQITDEAFKHETDVPEQEQMSLVAAQQDIFTGEDAGFYGAWMGSHLKAIAQISQHADQLLDAAIEDVQSHDGSGHHFRSELLKLGVPGVGPKVASFSWLLLQPLTSQLATIDTHMMDVLGHDYNKDMNNRDYFKFERELQAGRDAAGYQHVPLGQFQWGMWDYKRTGPGSHQDHSAMRVLDPVPHHEIDWASKAQNLKGDSWLKQAPEWWQATQPARDQVAQQWDANVAPQYPRNQIPFQSVVTARGGQIPGGSSERVYVDQRGLTLNDGTELWFDGPHVQHMVENNIHPDDVKAYLQSYTDGTTEDITPYYPGWHRNEYMRQRMQEPINWNLSKTAISDFSGGLAKWWKKKDLHSKPKLAAEYAAGTRTSKKDYEDFLEKHRSEISNYESFKRETMKKFDRLNKSGAAAFSQVVPWHVDQNTGEKITGPPGARLMRHLKDQTGLTTQEIWGLENLETGKDGQSQSQTPPAYSAAR